MAIVKETKFRHHPVRIENGLYIGSEQLDILGFRLDFQSDVLTSALNQLSTTHPLWQELPIYDYITVPDDAIAIVMSVTVNDSGSTLNATYMGFCPTGRILAGRCQYAYPGNVNSRYSSRIVITDLSGDTYPSIGYRIVAAGLSFDYSINLIGWLIGGTRVSRTAKLTEDLLCKFNI